ncbi:MAG: SpvB/TcaC N-terminal domain-containing protein, partial [Bacteroidota bacterium]
MSEPNAIPQTNSFSSGIELPRGGGAIRGLDEEFSANQAMGALSLTIPLPVAQARGFTPSLSVTYSSTEGNGSFGLGWSLNTPAISRRTNRGLPRYLDGEDSDVFQGPNGEELIRFLEDRGGQWEPKTRSRNLEGIAYRVDFYRPRTDATFNRIERWTPLEGDRQTHWRVISTDNVTSVYGRSIAARLADPEAANRIFTWFLERSYDDKGNLVEYDYRPDSANDGTWVNTYLHRVRYGNATSFRPLRGEQDGYA